MSTWEKIHAQRMQRGLSMADLARGLREYDSSLFKNMGASVISKIERNQRKVKALELKGFATVLRCKVVDLIDEVE